MAFRANPRPNPIDGPEVDIEDLLDAAEARTDLNSWEEEFIASTRKRFERYGEKTYLSDAQRAKLEEIAER